VVPSSSMETSKSNTRGLAAMPAERNGRGAVRIVA
jgi:hypothetical protein